MGFEALGKALERALVWWTLNLEMGMETSAFHFRDRSRRYDYLLHLYVEMDQ